MKGILTNGFMTADAFARCGAGNAVALTVAGGLLSFERQEQVGRIRYYSDWQQIRAKEHLTESSPALYLPDWDYSDDLWDEIAMYVLDTKAPVMVRCARTLEEVGRCDKRYGFSPVMLLHRMGILGGATVIGGVWLDKEDAALLRQENARLVLTPSDDLFGGNGIPPVVSFLQAGVSCRLGTGDGRYNQTADLYREAYLLKAAVCANMNRADAIPDSALAQMLTGNPDDADQVAACLYKGA